jgi:thiol-disulfide isomerase/thioredoxin
MTTAIVATLAALAVAAVAGWLMTRNSGKVREVRAGPGQQGQPADPETGDLGLSSNGPTVVHFSADWCGPCDRVRRVVDQVCSDLGDVGHVEVDLEANPEAARRFSVLSLPTTLIFDVDGRLRFRTSGVPKAADLRSALEPLLA